PLDSPESDVSRLLPDSWLCPSRSDAQRATHVPDPVSRSGSDCRLRHSGFRVAATSFAASAGRTIHLAEFNGSAPGARSFLRVLELCESLRILSRCGLDELLIPQGALSRRVPAVSRLLLVGSEPGHSGCFFPEYLDQRHECRPRVRSCLAIRQD